MPQICHARKIYAPRVLFLWWQNPFCQNQYLLLLDICYSLSPASNKSKALFDMASFSSKVMVWVCGIRNLSLRAAVATFGGVSGEFNRTPLQHNGDYSSITVYRIQRKKNRENEIYPTRLREGVRMQTMEVTFSSRFKNY